MWEWIWQNADRIGALAEGLTAIIAVAALMVAVVQIRAARRQQKEATAYSVYSEQLKLDLQFPEFSHPDLDALRRDGKLQQYDDYLAHYLYSCENILEVSDAPGWRHAILYGMRPHAAHIRDQVLRHSSSYSDEVVRLMHEVAGTSASTRETVRATQAGQSA